MAGLIEQERYTCAIGALQTVVAIPRAVPILHSGPGCGVMIKGFFERSAGYAGGETAPCTNFSEKEVVFGGTDRLRNIIKNTYKVLDTDLQVVVTGCTAGIVGDDVASVTDEFLYEEDRPIVHVETSGFKSNNYVSHSAVVNAIIDQYVSRFEDQNPSRSEKNLVNLIASIPYQDQFWKGNLKEYQQQILADIKSASDKREIPVYFDPDAGAMQDVIRGLDHKCRGLILGSGWDKELAAIILTFLNITSEQDYYIQLQKSISEDTKEKLGDQYTFLGFETFTKTGDIYCLFYEKGYHLLHNDGILSFITSNKWMRAGYGEKLRRFFADNTNPIVLIDFSNQRVFESATVDVNILIFSKGDNKGKTLSCIADIDSLNNLSVFTRQNSVTSCFSNGDNWTIFLSQKFVGLNSQMNLSSPIVKTVSIC